MKVQAAILAGGKSTRFGEDKALACLNGKTFLDRTIACCRAVSLEPVIVGSYVGRKVSDCRVYPDLVSGCGPLGGLYTAMVTYPNSSILALTCDMPLLSMDVIMRLLKEGGKEGIGITVFTDTHGTPTPFPGLYASRLRAIAGRFLDRGEYAMRNFLNDGLCDIRLIRWTGSARVFSNINRKEDLYEANKS